MPIRTAIWKVAAQPEPLAESSLEKEHLLEAMIVAAPRLLSEEWMLIGRQEDTGFGGRIDLLAVAPDGSLVLIELKRDRTPREVVAQALDYAGWVEKLRAEDIAAIYSRFAPGRSLAQDFGQRFGQHLDEETLNQSHQIIIVAASLDDSTERIVTYLSERDIPINVLCFQVFTHGSEQLLSRAWLLDPVHTQVSAAAASAKQKAPPREWLAEKEIQAGGKDAPKWKENLEIIQALTKEEIIAAAVKVVALGDKAKYPRSSGIRVTVEETNAKKEKIEVEHKASFLDILIVLALDWDYTYDLDLKKRCTQVGLEAVR